MFSEEQDKDIFAVIYNFYKVHKNPPEDIEELTRRFNIIQKKYNSHFVNILLMACIDEIGRNYKLKYNKDMPFEVE